MSCCYYFVKYLLFLINIVFAVVGLGIIAIGVIVKIVLNDSDDALSTTDISNVLNILAIGIIVLGSIVFLIAFSGCCGAVAEVQCLLITYSTILLVLAAAKIALVVVIFINKSTWRTNTIDFVNDSFQSSEYEKLFHALEVSFECCGTSGPESYKNGTLWILPPTCCPNFNLTSSDNHLPVIVNAVLYNNRDEPEVSLPELCTLDEAFVTGCTDVITTSLMNIVDVVRLCLIIIIVFELVVTMSAIYLSCSIRVRKRV